METVELQDNDVFTPSSASEDPDIAINNSDVQTARSYLKSSYSQCSSSPIYPSLRYSMQTLDLPSLDLIQFPGPCADLPHLRSGR
ncbi:hypothetical protein GJ496_006724 [Pomphorhynchus laevis]|nr:hypothetical protein GJ496_006724 [Pomphorhynchus laevis]